MMKRLSRREVVQYAAAAGLVAATSDGRPANAAEGAQQGVVAAADKGSYDPTVPPPTMEAYEVGEIARDTVRFASDGLSLAAHLYKPAGKIRGAVVLDGPSPSIKELVLPVYAIKLARAGYLALAFDRRGFGASEGRIRQHIDPHEMVRDIRNAATYLLSRQDVDPRRLAGVGVCMGGGFMIQALAMDRRFAAGACIAAHYSSIKLMHDNLGHEGWVNVLKTLSPQRLADLRAGAPRTHRALGRASEPAEASLIHIDEAYDYYMQRQKQIAPHWRNELTYESIENTSFLDGLRWAPLVAPTPLLIVHGTVDPNTPPRYAREAFDAASEPKKLVWIETANHIQLYDVEPYVTIAANAVSQWLDERMTAA